MRNAWTVLAGVLGVASIVSAGSAASAPVDASPKVVTVQQAQQAVSGLGLRLPPTWREVAPKASGMREFASVARAETGATATGRMTLTVEVRADAAGALARLREIDAEHAEPANYLEIAGWPALQRIARVTESLPGNGERSGARTVLLATTAIAIGEKVVRLQGVLPPGATTQMATEMLAIGTTLSPPVMRPKGASEAAVQGLRSAPRLGSEPSTPSSGSIPKASAIKPATKSLDGLVQRLADLGNANSEIAIAMSNDGRYVVVGSNSRDFRTSSDGGKTFPTSGTVAAGPGAGANGDPSIAFGASGNFYYAFIGFPAAVAGNNRCSTAMTRSTDNGQTFTFVADATVCTDNGGNACFPDQEHIAADRFNLSNVGGDLVYSTWRNFSGGGCGGTGQATGGPVIPTLVCSSDSGATWPTTRQVGNAGDEFPRITVGQDGFVYVVYRAGNNVMLNKFSSCDAGLNQVAGFPVTVAAGITDVTCKSAGAIPGLDRCNGRNTLSSHSVAVDDTNASHVFVAYANNTSAGQNEEIRIRDSTDGGATWPRSVRVDSGVTARRYMPWVCATSGTAFLSWYDMRFAVPGGGGSNQPNDRADFFGGSAYVNAGGSLVAGPEFRLSDVSDPLCASGWPSATDNAFDSETCGVQPQLAGICQNTATPPVNQAPTTRCDFSDCGGAGANTGGTCQCGAGFVCNVGRGAPKYGDYNYVACGAGRYIAAWASATSPPSITPASTGIDTFVKSFIVSTVPELQVSPVAFGPVCGTATRTLDVCNTGKADLVVDSIASSNAAFSIVPPSSGFPVTISPDFCFPFQAAYDGTGAAGTVSGQLTIVSNDPANPQETVAISAVKGAPSLNATLANAGNFGDVCRGSQADLNLQLVNQGTCTASVTGIVSSDPHFELSAITTFPLAIAPGGTVTVPIRFKAAANEACGSAVNGTVTVNAAGLAPLVVPVSATVPCPQLVLDPNALTGLNAFPPTVVDSTGVLGCFSERKATLRNTGKCSLSIDNVAATAPHFLVVAPTQFPLTIGPGGSVDARVRFVPKSDADAHAPSEITGQLTVTSSDPDAGDGIAALCGESVAQSGVRALAVNVTTGTPVPIDPLERLTLTSKGKNTPSPISIRMTQVPVSTANVCGRSVKWHLDEETLPTVQTTGSNPKSSYQLDVKQGSLQSSQSFDLGQCDFREMTLQIKSRK
jgi:hypothetical protein